MEKLLQILYENKILFHCFSKFEIFCAHLWHVTIMSHQNKVFLFFFKKNDIYLTLGIRRPRHIIKRVA